MQSVTPIWRKTYPQPPSSQGPQSALPVTRRLLRASPCPETSPNHIVWTKLIFSLTISWELVSVAVAVSFLARLSAKVEDALLKICTVQSHCLDKTGFFSLIISWELWLIICYILIMLLLCSPGLVSHYASVTAESVLCPQNLWMSTVLSAKLKFLP